MTLEGSWVGDLPSFAGFRARNMGISAQTNGGSQWSGPAWALRIVLDEKMRHFYDLLKIKHII